MMEYHRAKDLWNWTRLLSSKCRSWRGIVIGIFLSNPFSNRRFTIALYSSIVQGFWLLIAVSKKGDPPADLRDADGFCYRLIRTVLSENLLHFDCKNNVFFLELYKISISFLCVFFSVCGNIFLIFSADARTLCPFLISRMTIRTVTRRTSFYPRWKGW